MTHLSPATARALKAAGFPQPAPAIGQHWHLGDDNLKFVMAHDLTDAARFIMPSLGSHFAAPYTLDEISEMSYCPTAEDILTQLPNGCRNGKIEGGVEVVHYYFNGLCGISTYTGPTLSEALAAAYLALHPTPAAGLTGDDKLSGSVIWTKMDISSPGTNETL